MNQDLLNPTRQAVLETHKLKRLVEEPNSYFMDVKHPGCLQITTVFSHAQTPVMCALCSAKLCEPMTKQATGGKVKITDGCSIRRKVD